MKKLDDSYRVCIVKRNNKDKSVRLAELESLLRYHYTKEDVRTEIELISNEQDFVDVIWEKGSMLWFSPVRDEVVEATDLDEQAKKETRIARELIDKLPDVDPEKDKTECTLIVLVCQNDKRIAPDGQLRQQIIDSLRKRSN